MDRTTIKVAVVGSGLAGLTASYLLGQPVQGQAKKIEVHLFEKASEIGMDCASIALPLPGGKGSWRIDVPMRSFQGGYYRNLISFYRRLGVSFQPSNFTYSFSFLSSSEKHRPPTVTATALYNGANGLKGVSKPSVLNELPGSKNDSWLGAWAGTLWGTYMFLVLTFHLALCYAITLWQSLPFWRSKRLATMTLEEWAKDVAPNGQLSRWIGLDVAWQDYVHTILVPLMSAMCTAPEEDVFNHPVEEILDYVWLGLGQDHFVLTNGVQEVVSRLSSELENIHVNSAIVSLSADPANPRLISIECERPDGTRFTHHGFSHIVLATQASRAVPLLGCYARSLPIEATAQRHALEEQIRCLRTFKYCSTIVVNHTDDTLLPSVAQDRRDLNLISSNWDEDSEDSEFCVPSTYTMATHMLPRPEGYPSFLPSVYQTTNPFIPPQKDTVLSVSSLERAVLTPESKQALRGLCKPKRKWWWECPTETRCELGELQGAGRLENESTPGIWICGSYAYLGVPLLEGCVVSSRNVVEQGILKSEGLQLREDPWDT
ncbi:hypothetical protein CC2G_000888 [Coprinopsis cinerea AmutBmut pab1-1]|nr:hypothetical protein CC2G_000888 [Coprinopsis cinerea AmutBmut pab1-1]